MENNYYVKRDLVIEKTQETSTKEQVIVTDSIMLEETKEEKNEREDKSWVKAKKNKLSESHPEYYLG